MQAQKLPELTSLSNVALFLDFDGTLVEIAERPDGVSLAVQTRTALSRLHDGLCGGVAIVTGRDIAFIDDAMDPLRLPVAGIHGLTRRGADGRLYASPSPSAWIDGAVRLLASLVENHTGLVLERKSAAVALHYRLRPDLERACLDVVERSLEGSPDLIVKRGKMVIEICAGGASKGTAVAEFMREAPFSGRRPVFAGDDITDEDAFEVVNAMGGLTIKIGDGPTAAQWRAPGTAEFLDWLCRSAAHLTSEGPDS